MLRIIDFEIDSFEDNFIIKMYSRGRLSAEIKRSLESSEEENEELGEDNINYSDSGTEGTLKTKDESDFLDQFPRLREVKKTERRDKELTREKAFLNSLVNQNLNGHLGHQGQGHVNVDKDLRRNPIDNFPPVTEIEQLKEPNENAILRGPNNGKWARLIFRRVSGYFPSKLMLLPENEVEKIYSELRRFRNIKYVFEQRSSLVLQMFISGNILVFGMWLAVFIFTMDIRLEIHKELHGALVICIGVLFSLLNIGRLYSGYNANLSNEVQTLSLYWWHTFAISIPMVTFIILTDLSGRKLIPMAIVTHAIILIFLLLELVASYLQIKFLVDDEDELFTQLDRFRTQSGLTSLNRKKRSSVLGLPTFGFGSVDLIEKCKKTFNLSNENEQQSENENYNSNSNNEESLALDKSHKSSTRHTPKSFK